MTNDYYFCAYLEHDYPRYCIVKKDYWHENECLGYDEFDENLLLPADFDECSECEFERVGPIEEGIKELEQAGFTWCEEMKLFMQACQ